MASGRSLEDLDLSKDEVRRLGEALKDEKFRKMLVDYAEEISNPENRRKAEEEIAMMENERGMSVQFVHPEPGYVLKTAMDGSKKAFINICQNDKIDKPKASKQAGPDGKKGVMWNIPHAFAPPRDDYDKSKNKCRVFDVTFHPDTYRMAMSNDRFKQMVEDTAMDGIESQFSVLLDRTNVKRPKMKFKGVPQPTVIREKLEHSVKKHEDLSPDDLLRKMPYPYDNKTSSEKAKENKLKSEKNNSNKENKLKLDEMKFTKPKYTVKHRSEVDMSEYRNAPDAKISTCPKELVITIELPLLKSASQVNLDIFEKMLLLESSSPAAYKLELSLPYRVSEDEGSAKFDKSKRTLTVTLPVIPPEIPKLSFAGENGRSVELEIINTQSSSIKECSSAKKINDVINSESLKNIEQARFDMNDNVGDERSEFAGFMKSDNKLTLLNNVKWVLPSYQFSQDNETVTFVISSRNVQADKVETFLFPTSFTAVIQLISLGAGCFPVYYRLWIQFPPRFSISEHCTTDISESNTVFIILKDKKCRGLWDRFHVGLDENQLEEKHFLTDHNLKQVLADLEKETSQEVNMPTQVEDVPDLSVLEMNEKRLTIDIKAPRNQKWRLPDKRENEEEEYDPPSSAEIEVVHRHPLPDLHSILKQRTISESSEDINNHDPESPRSESDELSSSFSKKRSVSFNSYVDRASFKSSASVSSMAPSLKSKRRRQRRREEKKKGPGRSNSEGTSSSEECLHSVSDSLSLSEEEADTSGRKLKGGRKAALLRTFSDPGPAVQVLSTITEGVKPAGDSGKKKDVSLEGSGDVPAAFAADKVLDFRTSKFVFDSCARNEIKDQQMAAANVQEVHAEENIDLGAGENVKCDKLKFHGENSQDKKKQMVTEIKERLSRIENGDVARCDGVDSDDDHFVDAVSSLSDQVIAHVDMSEHPTLGDDQLHDTNNKVKGVGIQEMNNVAEMNGDLHSDRKLNGDGSFSERAAVEGISWDEGVGSSEHVTSCAIEFSNALMFDLEIE